MRDASQRQRTDAHRPWSVAHAPQSCHQNHPRLKDPHDVTTACVYHGHLLLYPHFLLALVSEFVVLVVELTTVKLFQYVGQNWFRQLSVNWCCWCFCASPGSFLSVPSETSRLIIKRCHGQTENEPVQIDPRFSTPNLVLNSSMSEAFGCDI